MQKVWHHVFKKTMYSRVGQKVSCRLQVVKFANYAPIWRNSTVRKLTKFQKKMYFIS